MSSGSGIDMKRICFLAFGAYPILSRQEKFYDVGGSELQQVLIGKELAKKGYEIIFIDFDYGQNQYETIEGIKIIKTFKPQNKENILEYVLHIPILLNALVKAQADIFYQRAGVYCIPVIIAKILKKPFVYSIPGDRLVASPEEKGSIVQSLQQFDITYADCIIAQSEYQRKRLKQNFGKNSKLIKSICVIENNEIRKNQTPLVLWVANFRELKQPRIFLELARKFPDVEFCMIGGPYPDAEKFFNDIKSEAEKIKNIQFTGFVPLHKVNKYFEKAWVLINTSSSEGFPNTFFQAWSNYTPVLSLYVDPDEIMYKNNLGIHSREFSQMVTDLDTLLKDDNLRRQMGLNGRNYVEKEHNIDRVINQYIDLFETVGKYLLDTKSGVA
jgi:glycosyltransferase involved in cell wall biosynthesis